jgi:hypothetical protein
MSFRVTVVVIISLTAIVVTELRLQEVLEDDSLISYEILLLNLGTAITGWWTPRRIAWLAYLALSGAAFYLMGAATPISGLATLVRHFF